MKKIENKQMKKNKFNHHCRAALLSLFVMLTIPSVSSSIFGNGDAEAQCIPRSSSVPAMAVTDAIINEHCRGIGADAGLASTCTGSLIGSKLICEGKDAIAGTTYTDQTACKSSSELSPVPDIYCRDILNNSVCSAAESCIWVAQTYDSNKLVAAVCRVYLIATGNAGKAFAAVGVISVGIGFFTGKVSWGLMISVAAGIAVFFGAPSIISVISGDNVGDLCGPYKV